MSMFSNDSQNQTTNTVYVFIDASNLWEALKAKGRFLDFERLGIRGYKKGTEKN